MLHLLLNSRVNAPVTTTTAEYVTSYHLVHTLGFVSLEYQAYTCTCMNMVGGQFGMSNVTREGFIA